MDHLSGEADVESATICNDQVIAGLSRNLTWMANAGEWQCSAETAWKGVGKESAIRDGDVHMYSSCQYFSYVKEDV